MGKPLDKLTIRGFKSIAKLEDFPLGPLNVLIGANGAGKSNFVEFFRLLRAMADEQLQKFVLSQGSGDGLFHHGPKQTPKIEVALSFKPNGYRFTLSPSEDESVFVAEEHVLYFPHSSDRTIGVGLREPALKSRRNDTGMTAGYRAPSHYVYEALSSWQVYHFHDTSANAQVRRSVSVDYNQFLLPDAGNLAAFLLKLKETHPGHYRMIVQTIQRVAPAFEDFDFKPKVTPTETTVRLTWKQKGSDYPFQPGHFSDGTLRFICLATALLQPNPPATIVFDEPELGLHPQALTLLGSLICSIATRTQLIVATQSPVLLSEFEPSQIITVNHCNGASEFKRLEAKDLEAWLEDFSIGDLWQKGVIRGGPNHA